MFVMRKKLDSLLVQRDVDIKALENKYWKLYHKYDLLLSYLGLTEVETPPRIELRKKGGPEREDL